MAIADGNGLPISVCIAAGSRHDVTLAEEALDATWLEWLPDVVIGDKAFDSSKLDLECVERGVVLVAPNRSNAKARKQDGRRLRRYKRRWKVERLFAWLKRFRRIAIRYERKAENFLGFLHLACILLISRCF